MEPEWNLRDHTVVNVPAAFSRRPIPQLDAGIRCSDRQRAGRAARLERTECRLIADPEYS
jgi:hypothetical protein